uniref:Uncharacterized protein n=1 Tax=Chromera velia CCMP2878 TaxID=1169474 RepID=A0A0G4I8X7_9ALVE|eukprot:Cvel_12082.t1-p1 / transcript=Cvel_12082.t1 / gene=Cvel_12082 / organism=Chromera_velia_CCMP2878 / gene_product=hypothetical protein / transcript_product=hypothetical protein / location=Cvel_scaffold777:60337-63857(-) / protein_length=303 / sequence_SO=supercontig / SO=protein_coding / is_pseudo=false
MSKSGAGLFISGDKKFVMKIDQDESMYDEMFTLALNRSLLIGPSHYPESPDHAALRKQYVLLNPYVFNKPMVMATYKSSGLFGSEYKVSITPHVGTMYKELIERYIAYGISVKGVPYTRTNSSRTFTPGQELEFPEAKLISLIDVKATNNNEEGRYTLEKKSGSEEDMKKAREEATLDKIKKEKRGFLRELENGWTSDKWRCYHYDVNNFLSCLRLMPLTKDNKAIEKDQAYAIDKFKVRTGWPAPKSMTCKDLLFWDSKRLGGNESPYCMKDVFKLQTESSHCELQQSKCSCRFLMSLEWRC